MKRGELWTARGESFASEPRPVLVIQSDDVDSFDSTVLCLITTHDSDALPTWVALEPTEKNGLREKSWVMTEKIYSARKNELGQRIGTLSERDMAEVSKQVAVVLGL